MVVELTDGFNVQGFGRYPIWLAKSEGWTMGLAETFYMHLKRVSERTDCCWKCEALRRKHEDTLDEIGKLIRQLS